jgi:hypothetical protein
MNAMWSSLTPKNIFFILLAAVTIGVLMGYRADLPFAWSRALVAALAFAVLGGLLSYVRARRR